jgi:hypothetical protein
VDLVTSSCVAAPGPATMSLLIVAWPVPKVAGEDYRHRGTLCVLVFCFVPEVCAVLLDAPCKKAQDDGATRASGD